MVYLKQEIESQVVPENLKMKNQQIAVFSNKNFTYSNYVYFFMELLKAVSHNAICVLRFFCTIMLNSKKWFTNQWI